MIKDVHITIPSPLLKKDGVPYRDDAFTRDFREHEVFWRRDCVAWDRDRALLAIASFIIHYLGWHAERGSHLNKMRLDHHVNSQFRRLSGAVHGTDFGELWRCVGISRQLIAITKLGAPT
jgi:hypothetical protein